MMGLSEIPLGEALPHETTLMPNGVHWRFHGVLTMDEIVEANSEIWNRHDWDSFTFQIVDLLAVQKAELGDSDMIAVSSMDKASARTAAKMRIALVATEPTLRDLCTIYAEDMTHPGWESRLFNDLESARRWAQRQD